MRSRPTRIAIAATVAAMVAADRIYTAVRRAAWIAQAVYVRAGTDPEAWGVEEILGEASIYDSVAAHRMLTALRARREAR